MKTIIMMIIIPTQMTTDGEGRKKFVNKNIKTVLVKFLLSRSSILSPHRIRVGVAMTQSSAPVVLAAGAGAERASTPKWARRSLWVVAGLGLIAVLVFQFENELVNLNAYGRRYLTGDRAPHKPVTLFENTPRDVVVESSEGVKPPMAPQEHTEQPPPPANAVPSGEDSDTAASSEEARAVSPAVFSAASACAIPMSLALSDASASARRAAAAAARSARVMRPRCTACIFVAAPCCSSSSCRATA